MPSMRLAPNTNLRAAAVYLLSFAVVIGYVNTFTLWRAFGDAFGTGLRDGLPWIMVAAIALGLAAFLLWKRSGVRISWRWMAAALLAAVFGLLITNPAFPGKRIHVPQYFLLTIIVWFALPARLRTHMTPVFVLVAAVLYGIHDEFLQGLHPRRTFGLRDMVVNLCGATSGICALLAFSAQPILRGTAAARAPMSRAVLLGLVSCVSGVLLFAWAATGYRNDLIPYWAVLPALAGAFWLAVLLEGLPDPGDRNSLRGIVAICCVFLIYPVLTNVAYLDFA